MTSQPHEYKLCPECREEYTLAATECAECRVALVAPHEAPAEEVPEAFPEIAHLVCIRVGPLPWTRAISEALTQAGIGHRVERDSRSEAEGGIDPERFGGLDLYGTWVRPEERESAAAIDAAIFAHFEPAEAETAEGEEQCPACEAALGPDDLECPECGLPFG